MSLAAVGFRYRLIQTVSHNAEKCNCPPHLTAVTSHRLSRTTERQGLQELLPTCQRTEEYLFSNQAQVPFCVPILAEKHHLSIQKLKQLLSSSVLLHKSYLQIYRSLFQCAAKLTNTDAKRATWYVFSLTSATKASVIWFFWSLGVFSTFPSEKKVFDRPKMDITNLLF